MARALLILAAAIAACCQPAPEATTGRAGMWRGVASWAGRGNTQLETFWIGTGRFRLNWQATGASSAGGFTVRLHSADSGRVLAEPVKVQGAGRNSVEINDDHQRFYLSVESADLDWSIRVEEFVARP